MSEQESTINQSEVTEVNKEVESLNTSNNETTAPAEENINEEEELEEMKQRVKEMEAEAAKIMEMSEEADKTETITKEDVDNRSVYVGNVDYTSTPEELQTLFQSCGTINRITIIHDRFTGHPKGYAYIEFADAQSVQSALIFNELQFKGRPIKVLSKRTNLPGLAKRGRGVYRGGFRGYRGSYFGRGGRGAYRGYYAPY